MLVNQFHVCVCVGGGGGLGLGGGCDLENFGGGRDGLDVVFGVALIL